MTQRRILPGLGRLPVTRAVDASRDVQLAATDRPDARVDDGDVGVHVRRGADDRPPLHPPNAVRHDLAGDAEATRWSHAHDLAGPAKACCLGSRQTRREAGHDGRIAVPDADIETIDQAPCDRTALDGSLASRDAIGALAEPEDGAGMDGGERDDVGPAVPLRRGEGSSGQERREQREAQGHADGDSWEPSEGHASSRLHAGPA